MEIIELSVGEIVISLPVIHLYSVMSWSWAPTPSGAEEKSPWMIVYRGDGRELNNKKFIIAVVWTDMNEDMILWLSICTLTIWWCAERKWIIILHSKYTSYNISSSSVNLLTSPFKDVQFFWCSNILNADINIISSCVASNRGQSGSVLMKVTTAFLGSVWYLIWWEPWTRAGSQA